jgi:phosphohistidine phosphatase
MKSLFIVRHAKSSWSEIGKTDFERTLDTRGHADAPRMAELAKNICTESGHQKRPYFVSSPANRAHTTAQYFAKAFGVEAPNIYLEHDIYEADLSEILQIVRQLPDEEPLVFLFGHNPSFTYFANFFSETLIENMPTCSFVRLDLKSENWSDFKESHVQQTGFWYPKQYL